MITPLPPCAPRCLVVMLLLWLAAALPLPAAFPNLGELTDKLKKVEGTASKVGQVVKGASGLTLEEEIAVGDAVALEIVRRFGGLWRDEAATVRVNILGKALARYADRQDLNWRFALLASDTVNAYSAPGGRVFITRGLYQKLDTDDRLAGVLGHEIEHIDRRHAVKIIARGEFLSGVNALVSERSSDFAQFDKAISEVTTLLLEKGFDHGTEFEADQHGRNLAHVTGFAPGGLRAVLVQLRKDGGGKAVKEVFSTHPPLDERLKRLPTDPEPPAPAR
jgi:predicted Zn-dependent protease